MRSVALIIVMILYATVLNGVIPDPLGHILVASFIHVAAAITIARIMVPETGEETAGSLIPPRAASSSMDAIVKGTTDGLYLLLNIVAMGDQRDCSCCPFRFR